MRCIAVIEAERPGLDSVLIWDRDGEMIAFAYLNGKVTMTRPLQAQDTLDNAINEAAQSFQINSGQLIRVTDWANSSTRVEPVAPTRTRW
jgi:hypothetical protein